MERLPVLLTVLSTAALLSAEGLSVGRGGVLLKDGRAYRAIGVNCFDAFERVLKNPEDSSLPGEFKKLAEHGVPFVRFAANGFWPVDNRLYFQDKEAYFRELDGVVKAAEQNGLGLIPSLFWNHAAVPDMMHEPISAWGDRKSRTLEFMRAYTREIVERYRHSPAIWAWEFGNEYNNEIDFPDPDKHRAKVEPKLGTATTRSEKDDLTLEMLTTAFKQFVKTVRKLDRDRVILSGNSIPRPAAHHNHAQHNGKPDTPKEWASMLLDQNKPFPVITVHCYIQAAVIPVVRQIGLSARKPVFVEEFGPIGPDREAGNQQFRDLLQAIEQSGVPLAALWNFDMRVSSNAWNLTFENQNAWMLKEIADANTRLVGRTPSSRSR